MNGLYSFITVFTPLHTNILDELSASINECGHSTQSWSMKRWLDFKKTYPSTVSAVISNMATCDSGEDIQAIVHAEVGGSDEKRSNNVCYGSGDRFSSYGWFTRWIIATGRKPGE